jgi:hypothetical protein
MGEAKLCILVAMKVEYSGERVYKSGGLGFIGDTMISGDRGVRPPASLNLSIFEN